MTRDDLYGHYRRYYVPEQRDAGHRRRRRHRRRAARASSITSARFQRRRAAARATPVEPPQQAERRVHFRKEGTTAYWRAAFHAPAVGDPDFFPMLFVDAALSGASGLNIWSGHKVPTPQRSARLYRAARRHRAGVERRRRVLPTEHPFLYYLWATVADGQTLQARRRRDPRASSIASRAKASPKPSSRRCGRSCARASSTTATASPTSRISSATSRRSASWRTYHELIPRLAHVTLDQVNAAARRYLDRRQPDDRLVRAEARTVGQLMPLDPLR